MTNKYCYISMAAFAMLSFVSLAVGNALLAIATLCFLIYAFKNRAALRVPDKTYYLAIGIFIGTMLISAFLSGDIKQGMKVWINAWFWRLMPFFIITLTIREAKQAKRILACSLAGIAIGALCVVHQGLGGDARAAGFFGHPMTFAGYFCIYLPLLFVLLFEESTASRWRWYMGGLLILLSAALLYNATRGAWLAVASVTVLLLLYYLFRPDYRKLAACVVCFLIIVGAGLSQYQPFVDRMVTITDENYQSNTERLLIWHSAYEMFKDQPVTGVGLGQYKDNYQKKYISPEAKEPLLAHAHNNFMQMLAENGLIGFAGFMTLISCFIGYSFKRFWQEGNPYALMMCASALALVLQGLTEYNFGNGAVMKSFWLVQGCLLVLSQNWKKESPEQDA